MLTSLYVHIPFCDHICTYCDFHKSLATDKRKEDYIDALVKELLYRKNDLVNITTIFIGGGTPLSLSIALLRRLFQTIEQVVNIKNVTEYSIETNPNNLTEEKIVLLKQYHISRVSIGVQTFNPVQLIQLGRDHTVSDIPNGINLLRQHGITNISIDLMFSLVNQTTDDVLFDLERALELDVPHISYYALIWEEKTTLYHHYEQGKVSMNTEDIEALMYTMVIDKLTKYGYHHYEISNFAKPGHQCKHNKTYWYSMDYLGVGSGAHSLWNNKRFYHPTNTSEYIKRMNANEFEWFLQEDVNLLGDTMLMGMRLMEGLSITDIEHRFRISLFERYPALQQHIDNQLVTIVDGRLCLTRKGILLGNEVFQTFVEES